MSRLFDDVQFEYLQRNEAILSNTPLAMVCWFKSDDVLNAGTIISIFDKDADINYCRLHIRPEVSGNTIIAQSQDSGGNNFAETSTGHSVGTWHHGCAIFASSIDRRVFIDDGSKGVQTTSRTPINLDRINIGYMNDANPFQPLSGKIAEAAIYDLSAYPGATDSDKADYFEANVLPSLAAGDLPSKHTTGLEAYWSFRTESLEDEADGFDLTASGTSVDSDHPPMIRYLVGSITASSGVTGSLSSENSLIGSIAATSGVTGSLDSQQGFIGSIIETSGITGTIVKFVTLSNGPVWLGIDSSHLDSYCGHGDNQPCANALDGTGTWYHWVDGAEADEHWLILDLGASFIVSEVRSRSMTSMDPTNVDIYISDDKEDWGEAVATGISDWQDTGTWQIADVDDKRGQYILIDIRDVEGSPASGQLQYGDSDPPFKILDVFGVLADQALSNVTGSLSSIDNLIGSITATSGVIDSLSSEDGLSSSIIETSGVIGSLAVGQIFEFKSSITETSDVTGSLSSEDRLIGSIIETSGIAGSLDFIGEIRELIGSIVETSSIIGSLDRQPRLYSSLIAFSNIIGSLSSEDRLAGSIMGTSSVVGFLSSVDLLIGNGICGVSSAGEASVIRTLFGSITGVLEVSGIITFVPIGFYESLANQITTYLQDIADLNSLSVRYDNDLRETPTDNLWYEASVDFGISEKSDLGIDSYRNPGNLNIRVKNSIGLGTSELYRAADIMVEAFKRKNLIY